MELDDLGKELAKVQPETKIGKLRKYMPLIEQKLAEGASAKSLVEVLSKFGIDLDVKTFRSYVQQYKKQKRSTEKGTPSLPIESPSLKSKVDEKQSSELESPKKREPLTVQQLAKTMSPDPIEFAKSVEEKERLYKEHLKNQQRKK